MGLYVEVPNKLGWLQDNGVMTTKRGIAKDDEFLVCCVNNVHFHAVGVAYDERELKVFSDSSDGRQKFWFRVKKDVLKPVCPEWDSYIGKDK